MKSENNSDDFQIKDLEITPAMSGILPCKHNPEEKPKPISKFRQFFFPRSVAENGVPRLISIDFLRGLRILTVILMTEVNEMLDVGKCSNFTRGFVIFLNYFLSTCKFILCQLIALYSCYSLCQSNGQRADQFREELRNVAISIIQVPIWLLFDILESHLKELASGVGFELNQFYVNSYTDFNIFAYFGVICIPFQIFTTIVYFSLSRIGKMPQIVAFGAICLTISVTWFFVAPFVSYSLNSLEPEGPLYIPMNSSLANYVKGVFCNFFDGRKFSFVQLFPLHLQGAFYGAMYSLFKRASLRRSSKLLIMLLPVMINGALLGAYQPYLGVLLSRGVRTFRFDAFDYAGYREPGVLTQEYVIFLSFWQAAMLFASFLFFEAGTERECDSRADKSLFIRRYSTLAWYGVGRNYATSIILRTAFGCSALRYGFLAYFAAFVVLDHCIICAADLAEEQFTHDWILAATRAWMNGKPFANMQDLHRRVAPGYLARKEEDEVIGA